MEMKKLAAVREVDQMGAADEGSSWTADGGSNEEQRLDTARKCGGRGGVWFVKRREKREGGRKAAKMGIAYT